MTAEQILTLLQTVAMHPEEQLRKFLAAGKKVVGCFPSYTPEELVTAGDMVPMGLWGGTSEPYLAKRYLPAFACPILQSNLEFGLRGIYNGMSAVLIPTLCDTFRCITQDWKAGVANIPMIPVSYPQNRTQAGIRFLSTEFDVIRRKLETIAEREITERDIQEAIDVYTRHTDTMREFSALANEHLDLITPMARHWVMKSAWFMDKVEHTAYVSALNIQMKSLPPYVWKGKRIILTGISAEPDGLLNIMAENGMAVVGDDLAQESRQYRADIPDGSALNRLAGKWKDQLCSLAHDASKARVDMLLDLTRVTGADGVIACMMKFCDPEEYDYPIISKALAGIDIPTLFLEVDQQPGSIEQVRTRLQTFAEMIGQSLADK